MEKQQGFGISGLGFRVGSFLESGWKLGDGGSGFRAEILGFGLEGLRWRIRRFEVEGLRWRVWGGGFEVEVMR